MGCPVHIWVPMMAALAPAATLARHRIAALMPRRSALENPAEHIDEMPRWSAVGSKAATPGAD
jgi:hypothetical protein